MGEGYSVYEEYYRVGGMKAKPMTRGQYYGWEPGKPFPEEYDFKTDVTTTLIEADLNTEGYVWENYQGFCGWSNKEEFERLYQKVK